MLKKYSLKTLELALNKAIALDEHYQEKLQPMNEKVLQLVIMPLQVHFFIHFSTTGIELLEHYEAEPHTIIQSSPLGLIRLSLLPASQARSLFNDSIKISGNIELGQQVKTFFDGLDIDWEGHLAQFTGDVVAYQIGSFVRKGMQLQQQVSESLQFNINEFVAEELRLTPPKAELEDFYADVDELSLAAERLQAQFQQLVREI